MARAKNKKKPARRAQATSRNSARTKKQTTTVVDDLARPVMLYVCTDGTLTFRPLFGPAPTGLTGDWRDAAIDLILEGRTEDAAGVLVENRNEPMLPEQERENYSLPVFSVETLEQARAVQARFCRLMYEAHPFMERDERWYVLTRFSGEVEDLHRVAAEFRDFYGAISDGV